MKRREFLAAGIGFSIGGLVGGGNAFAAWPNRSRYHVSLVNPIEQISESYDTVVIGSGYGASVMAARLASQTGRLCVLERGREWQPGEFPTTGYQLSQSVRRNGNPLGLFDISSPSGSDVDIISGNGLGGTSLINAAIAIRPLSNVFLEKEWPEEIREASQNGELEKFYQLAESVLKPAHLVSIGSQAKTQVLRQNANALGRRHGELRLNIRPESSPEGLNEFGVKQGPCIQCGDCCAGCNFGAKNTLATNYLAIAKKNGAEIYTQCEVDTIEKVDAGYKINLVYTGFRSVRRVVVHAKRVFLGAGAKGSTEILIRSQTDHVRFSQTLGTRLSANGDVMGMAYNTKFKTNILGLGSNVQMLSARHRPGPIIASYADYREPSLDGDVKSQFLLLDGVVPSAFRNLIGTAFGEYAKRSGAYYNEEQLRRIERDIEFGSSEEGALNHSHLYFACGHDSSGGRFSYSRSNRRNIQYVWKNAVHEPTFERINSVMKKFAEGMDGTFIPNPRSTVFGEKIQATHPLGGCPMGGDVSQGVVNHLGQVFKDGGGVHDGLYVVDASIIPRSLAATPLLTITALAERIAASLLKK